MEDPIFDAIFALCVAAEDDGFVAVADGLELVLDLYLLEKAQNAPPDPMFISRRAEAARRVAKLRDWNEALNRSTKPAVQTSSHIFPLLMMNSA